MGLPTWIGHYQILREIARGGMGVVYLAHDPRLDRQVAIKLVLPQALQSERAAQIASRFHEEANLLARLRHPNIVSVHDTGTFQGCPFLVMEFVQGSSLEHLLQRGPLPLQRALTLVRQVALALAACHDLGIVHRDVKPQNVLLDPQGHPLLTDFGLALDQARAERLTKTGEVLGTPHYMAPEQVDGARQAVGPWTDVWALGCLLHATLTGAPPFQGHTIFEILNKILTASPPSLPSPTPPAVDDVLAKCLHKQHAQRYPHARDLARDLTRLIEGDTPTAPFLRKRFVHAIGLPLLLATLGGTLWSWTKPTAAHSPTSTPTLTPSPLDLAQEALDRATQEACDGCPAELRASLIPLTSLQFDDSHSRAVDELHRTLLQHALDAPDPSWPALLCDLRPLFAQHPDSDITRSLASAFVDAELQRLQRLAVQDTDGLHKAVDGLVQLSRTRYQAATPGPGEVLLDHAFVKTTFGQFELNEAYTLCLAALRLDIPLIQGHFDAMSSSVSVDLSAWSLPSYDTAERYFRRRVRHSVERSRQSLEAYAEFLRTSADQLGPRNRFLALTFLPSEHPDAPSALERARQLDAEHPWIFRSTANLLHKRNQYDAAADVFLECLHRFERSERAARTYGPWYLAQLREQAIQLLVDAERFQEAEALLRTFGQEGNRVRTLLEDSGVLARLEAGLREIEAQ